MMDVTLTSTLEARIRELEIENFRLRKEMEKLSQFNSHVVSRATANLLEHEDRLLERDHELQTILDHMPAMIGYWDRNLRNRFGNQAYSTWFGISPGEMAGMHIRDVLGEERYRLNLPYIEAALRGEAQEFERAIPTPDGSRIRYSLAEYIPDTVNGEVRGFFVQVSDITTVKEAEETIKSLAFYDALTNLPNRRLFNDRLKQAMAAGKRSKRYCAVMYLDLDNFKSLNDTHGHGVGDLLLVEVARRLKESVREMDTVARFGGDEFVVLLNDLDSGVPASSALAGNVAEKVRLALAKPYRLNYSVEGETEREIEHIGTTSIGVVLFQGRTASQDDILRWADASMYEAKRAGGNSISFHQDRS
jgi:diguanylate cyclase (GGDEF)-like protein/PAS domain S-box-containing protein